MEVHLPLDEIRDLLRKRQKAMRGWLTANGNTSMKTALAIALIGASWSVGAADIGAITKRDRAFVEQGNEKQTREKIYRDALRKVEDAEKEVTKKIELPYSVEMANTVVFKPIFQPIVNPAFRRLQQPNIAILSFDATGPGRIKNVKVLQSSPNPDWGADMALAAPLMLLEPYVQGGVGITRKNVLLAFSLGFEGNGQHCDEGPKLDESTRITQLRLCVGVEVVKGR